MLSGILGGRRGPWRQWLRNTSDRHGTGVRPSKETFSFTYGAAHFKPDCPKAKPAEKHEVAQTSGTGAAGREPALPPGGWVGWGAGGVLFPVLPLPKGEAFVLLWAPIHTRPDARVPSPARRKPLQPKLLYILSDKGLLLPSQQ